jgi:hypothetical protein
MLRGKIDGLKTATEAFVSDNFNNLRQYLAYYFQDNLMDPIRDEAAAAGECERRAEKALEHAKACHMDWVSQKDDAFSFRKTVLRQDYKKLLDDAGQSSESV